MMISKGKNPLVCMVYRNMCQRCKGFCQSKKNPKIREKLGNGLEGQAPTQFFFSVFFLWCLLLLYMFPKKYKIAFGLANPSFSQIYGFILPRQDL